MSDGLKAFKLADLKEMCRSRGLPVSGNKLEIVERLAAASAAGAQKESPVEKAESTGAAKPGGSTEDPMQDAKKDPWSGGAPPVKPDDPELKKEIVDRKDFHKWVSKFTNKKGET